MKFLKILGIVVVALVVLIVAATIVAKIIFTKEKILSIVIPKIEQAIHRQVVVKDASLSIFPSISVNVDSLVIKNPAGFQQENLISLEKFSVKLKLLPLLRKRVELSKLIFVKPDIYLEKTGEKRSNYQDFLQSDKEKKIVPITFDRLEIEDARIVFYNRPQKSTFVIQDLDQEGKLQLIEDRFLATEGKLSIGNIQLKSSEGVLSYPLELDYKANYDLLSDSLKIDRAEIKFAKIRLTAEGKLEDLTRQPRLGLKLQSDDLLLSELLAWLPSSQKKLTAGWRSSGTVSLKAEGKWDFSQGAKPFQLDGEILGKNIQLSPAGNLPQISIPLMTTKLSEKNIILTTSQAKVGEAPLQLKAVVDNLDDPSLSGEVSSTVDLAILPKPAGMPEGTNISGRLEMSTSFFGKLKDLRNLNVAGTYNLANVNYSSPSLSQPIENLNARLKLTQGELIVENLSATQGQSSFALNGYCKELVPYLLAKKEQKEEYKPTFNFNFSSTYLNLDEILPAQDTLTKAKSDSTSSNALYLGLARFMNFDGQLKIDKAIFRKVELTDFKADLSLIDGVVKLTNVSSQVYSGTAAGQAVCDLSNPENVKFDIKVESGGMEANDFLSRFSRIENHLYGKLNFQGSFSGQGNSLSEIQNSLTGDGKISLAEGKLVNWDFAKRLSGFLGMKEFDEEPIKDLKNNFVIKNARLYFQDFLATSKKGDWKLGGSIGLLDQSLDYSLVIFLSPEVSSQVTVLGEQAKFLKDEKERLLIPLKISGTASSPKFAVDLSLVSQRLQNQLKQSLQERKSEVKEDLLKQGKEALEGLLKKKKKDG